MYGQFFKQISGYYINISVDMVGIDIINENGIVTKAGMEKLQDQLLQNTAMGIFAVILLLGLVLFAGWTKSYVELDRKNKEARIAALEEQVHDLQHRYTDELKGILLKHESMIVGMQAMFTRMEKLWERIEDKI